MNFEDEQRDDDGERAIAEAFQPACFGKAMDGCCRSRSVVAMNRGLPINHGL
ncbi:hypothetical protein [Paraburkholderia silvatlantica]|uniref:hypothetical protein n=1 Tax=Paraburkholderia silvatlantica TaxID=321895 RepID=UPI001FD3C230|nr:hypothetical protein [Paraburkholderia silvatlantica]